MPSQATTERKIKKLLRTVFAIVQGMKGEDILVLDMRREASYTDYLLIASCANERQIRAMADGIVDAAFTSCELHPLGTEGFESLQWVLVDFGDVVCHLFLQDARPLYHIEDMWPQIVPMNETVAQAFLKAKVVKKKVKGTSKNSFQSEILIPSSEPRTMRKKPGDVATELHRGLFAKSDTGGAKGAKLQPKGVFRGALKLKRVVKKSGGF